MFFLKHSSGNSLPTEHFHIYRLNWEVGRCHLVEYTKWRAPGPGRELTHGVRSLPRCAAELADKRAVVSGGWVTHPRKEIFAGEGLLSRHKKRGGVKFLKVLLNKAVSLKLSLTLWGLLGTDTSPMSSACFCFSKSYSHPGLSWVTNTWLSNLFFKRLWPHTDKNGSSTQRIGNNLNSKSTT